MTIISVSFERFAFGNEHWRAYRAMDEIEIYCDLLENLQDRIDSLARIHRWTRTEGVRTQEGGVRKLQTRWPGLEFG